MRTGSAERPYGMRRCLMRAASFTASRTRSSVSGRGTSTFLSTLKIWPQNSVLPTTYWMGSPAWSRTIASARGCTFFLSIWYCGSMMWV